MLIKLLMDVDGDGMILLGLARLMLGHMVGGLFLPLTLSPYEHI